MEEPSGSLGEVAEGLGVCRARASGRTENWLSPDWDRDTQRSEEACDFEAVVNGVSHSRGQERRLLW